MISRVRKFSTNEYYYCLQSFGGSNKPATVEAFERHICSNRFLYKPEFIMSRQNFNGTREYPYKDAGYWLWVYNELEKARDKNMFLYNFLREQYHAGVGEMSWLDDTNNTNDFENQNNSRITAISVDVAKVEIKVDEEKQIAEAEAISDTTKADIEKRMEDEKEVSASEVYSLQRRRLLDCFELGECVIPPAFVHEFNTTAMKSAFHNRKALARGVDVLMTEESKYFNGLFEDNVSVQDDLGKNYKSLKMVIAKELVEMAGFSGFYDEGEVSKDTMLERFKEKEAVLIEKMPAMCDVLGKTKRRRPDIANWTESNYLPHMLKFVNSITSELFQLKIKETGRRTGIYAINGQNQFNFGEDSIWFRVDED
jgi:hypothetical protein